MRITAHDLSVDLPPGWEGRIGLRTDEEPDAVSKPVLQAATVPLPEERGDFGSGVVELLGPNDAFVSLVQYGGSEVGTRLFKDGARPRRLAAEQFKTNQLQRWQPGQAGLQVFFTDAGRAFCLYVVLGSFGDRVRLVGEVNKLLAGLRIGAGPLPPPNVQ